MGTELNLVDRLAREMLPENKVVQFMATTICMCSTMQRIDPQHLAWTLENLAEGKWSIDPGPSPRSRTGQGWPSTACWRCPDLPWRSRCFTSPTTTSTRVLPFNRRMMVHELRDRLRHLVRCRSSSWEVQDCTWDMPKPCRLARCAAARILAAEEWRSSAYGRKHGSRPRATITGMHPPGFPSSRAQPGRHPSAL